MHLFRIDKLITQATALILFCLAVTSSYATSQGVPPALGQLQVERPKTAVSQNYLLEQLQQATQAENANWVKDLLAKGADPGQSGKFDAHSALTLALAMDQMPLAYSMLPYLRSESFNTAQRALFYTARRGDLALLNTLLAFTGEQALAAHSPATHCEINEAIRYGHKAIVERLYNLRPDCQDQLLFTSVNAGQTEIFTWLLNQATPEQKQALTEESYMHAAIQAGSLKLIQQLEHLGNKYYSAETALRAKHLNVLKYYVKTGKLKATENNYTLLTIAAELDSIELLDYLKSLGFKPTQVSSKNEPICPPASHAAAAAGASKALQWLLENKASIVDTCTNNSLLHAATQGNQATLLVWLLNNRKNLKLDINASNLEGDTALHLATRQGNLTLVNELLTQGAKQTTPNQAGNTALHEIIANAYTDNFQAILSKLLNSSTENGLNIKNSLGNTPLLAALDNPDETTLRLFLTAGAQVNLSNNEGLAALHKLANSGAELAGIVNLLVAQGAQINQKDYSGKTPLYYAIKSYSSSESEVEANQDSFLAQLLAYKPEINIADNEGTTPLILAIQLGKLTLAKQLIELGADIKIADKQGNTPLHYTAELSESMDFIKLLVAKGAEINALNQDGNSPIFFSANASIFQTLKDLGADINLVNKNNESVISVFTNKENKLTGLDLIEKAQALGVDVSKTDINQQNALHRSIRFNSPTLSLSLVKAKINLDQADYEGNTPLMLAVRNRSLYHVKLLIEHAANVNLANRFGKTALQQAIELGETELFNLLLAAHASINTKDMDQRSPLLTALANNRTDMAAKLIALGADVNIRSKGEWTALHYATQMGNVDLVKVLLDNGAVNGVKNWGNETPADLVASNSTLLTILNTKSYDVNYFQTTDLFKNTPLHWAVRAQNLAKITELLPKSDLNAHNSYDETPLELAIKSSRHNSELATAIIEKLLDAGADAQSADRYGNTPLYYALQNSAPLELIDALLAKNADLTTKNNYGDSLALWLPWQNLAVLKRLFSLQPDWLKEHSTTAPLWTWAVEHPEREQLTEWLLVQGVNPNQTSENFPYLPMALALKAHAYELLEPLRKAGGHLQKEADDLSTLNWLIMQGALEASLELIKQSDYKLDFSKQSELTENWLMTLTENYGNESTQLVRELVKRGVRPVNNDNALLHLALEHDADLLVRVYHQAGLPLTGLMLKAAEYNALRSLDYLNDSKVSIEETDDNGQTPLALAITKRHIAVVSWLLKHGANTENTLLTPVSANLTFTESNAESVFFKQLKQLLPAAKPTYALVEQLLGMHNYQAVLVLLDNWQDTLTLVKTEFTSSLPNDAGSENELPAAGSASVNLSQLFLESYQPDPEQAGLAVLKRLVAAGESLNFLNDTENVFNLGAKAHYPELFKTLYELGYHYDSSKITNNILEAIFASEDANALVTFNFSLQLPELVISPDIFNALSSYGNQDNDQMLATNIQAIYTKLVKYFYPNSQASKLKESYLINMLASTDFCALHTDLIIQQMAITAFTDEFFQEKVSPNYRALPCLTKPELLIALTNQTDFNKVQLQELGFVALANNYTNLDELKLGTETLLGLGANINSSSATGDTLATQWLNTGLSAYVSDTSSLTPALTLEGLSYLQTQGLKFTTGRNLTHDLLSAELGSQQIQNLLPLMDGILSLQPELASLPNQVGQQTLHLVAMNKSLGFDWQRRMMQRLFKDQPDLNASDKLGNTPLLAALQAGNLAIADWLIEQGADIQHSNQAGETALHFAFSQLTQDFGKANTQAALANADEINTYLPTLVERLLKKGATVNSYDAAGNSPLHRLALQPCEATVSKLCELQVTLAQALLAAKAEVDTSNADGVTPLLLTAYSGNTELARLLLEYKAQVNQSDKLGNQTLSLSLDHGYYGLADELISQGADIQQTNWTGLTALKRVQDLKEWGLASVITLKHPEVTWDKEWQIAQQQPRYFYALLAAQRLLAVAASKPFEQTSLYNDPRSNNTLLHRAARANDQAFIAQLLKQQHPIDILNNQGETPLHWAVKAEANQAISALLAAGANPQLMTAEQQDALMLAVITNNASTLQMLLESAVKTGKPLALEQQDKDGKSLLHHALATQNLQLLETLLKAGVNPELADNQQRTALLYAVEQGHLPLIKMLVQYKASLSAINQQQRTPLLYTIGYYVNEANDNFKQHLAERTTLIDYLLEQGADLKAVDIEGNTALHLGMPFYEIGQHLLSKGADIHPLNNEGESAIFKVIAANYPERQVNAYLQTLLDKGLDINARNKYGETLLSKAVRHDKIQVMVYLLEQGADPTVAKEFNPEQAGFTLPMYIVKRSASTSAKIKLLTLLKDKGADLNALNTRGENVLFLAAQASPPDYELMNWLMTQGVSARIINQQEQSILHLLIASYWQLPGNKAVQQEKRQQLLATLIQQGLNLNARDMNGRSALHYALDNHLEWVEALLVAGINPNLQSNTEQSALYLALQRFMKSQDQNLNLIKNLLAHKADPNQRNSQGETCLFLAYRAQNPELIQLLLTHGANPALKSYYGKLAGQD